MSRGLSPLLTSQGTSQPSATEHPLCPPSSHPFSGLWVCLQQLPMGSFQEAISTASCMKRNIWGFPQHLMLGSENTLRGGDPGRRREVQNPSWISGVNISSAPVSAEGGWGACLWESRTLSPTLPSCPSGHRDVVTRRNCVEIRVCPFPSSLLLPVTGLCFCSLQRSGLAPGGLAGQLESCSEHTPGLVFSILALSHPTLSAGCDQVPAELARVSCGLHSGFLF